MTHAMGDPLTSEMAQLGVLVAMSVGRRARADAAPDDDAPPELPPLEDTTPLAYLARTAGLDDVELAALRLAIAAELDPAVSRMMRRLAQDPTRPGTEVDTLVCVLGDLGVDAVDVLAAFDADARLIGRGLVGFVGGSAGADGPLLTRRITVHPRVLAYATGRFAPPTGEPLVTLRTPRPTGRVGSEPDPSGHRVDPSLRSSGELVLRAADLERVRRGLAIVAHEPLWLCGPRGAGKRTLLASLCHDDGRRLACVGYHALRRRRPAEALALLWREAILLEALICIEDVEPEAGEAPEALRDLYELVRREGPPAVWVATQLPAAIAGVGELAVAHLGLPGPADRLALWERCLPACEGLEPIVTRFTLAPGQIVHAARAAERAAALAGEPITPHHVVAAVTSQMSRGIAQAGQRIEVSQRWDDVVLPADTLASIREMVDRARHRHQVLERWGFARKLGKGLGIAALFSGPPGTGKTMVAGLIARDLDLELWQIDLSRVVSKYIGETEKQLASIFDAAEGANVMLLFDEADSLFAQRTEVKSSNDRYANLEVNFLLQRMERFGGISILTTNLEGSIDNAFKRRLAFRIAFPMPDADERAELWRRMVPAEAPIAGALDFDALAARYEINGGSIRNGMVRAAFLAAADGGPITARHVERAMALEYQDAGSLSTFGRLRTG